MSLQVVIILCPKTSRAQIQYLSEQPNFVQNIKLKLTFGIERVANSCMEPRAHNKKGERKSV